LVVSKHVVFLFDGDLKTRQRAQDCPNVGPYFRQANKISKAINRCFVDKELRWNEFDDDIEFDDSLEIFLS
jgi:hypothetical protein